MSEISEPTIAFRNRNRWLELATTIVIAVIAAMIAVTLFVFAMKGSEMRSETIGRMSLSWLPTIFYLLALWSVRDFFRVLSRGENGFGPLIRVLSQIGWSLMFGAATTFLITPLLVLLSEDNRLRNGFALFNAPALTLAIVGVALIVLSRMMVRAQALEAEAARLKTELEEFF